MLYADKNNECTTQIKLVALYIGAYFLYAICVLIKYKHLPAPFYYDYTDSFMDYFNSMAWANKGSYYQNWKTVYHELTFSIVRYTESRDCYHVTDQFILRSCSKWSLIYLLLSYCAGTYLCIKSLARSLKNYNIKSNLAYFVIVILNFPLIYGLERGNTIVYVFLLIAIYLNVKSNLISSTALAIAILLKPYLVILLLPKFIYKKWIAISIVLINILAISMLVGFDLGKAEYLISNLQNFANAKDFSRAYLGTSFANFFQYFDIAYLKIIFYCASILILVYGMMNFIKSQIKLDEHYLSYLLLVVLLVFSGAPGVYSISLLLPLLLLVRQFYTDRKFQLLNLLVFMPFGFVVYRLPGLLNAKYLLGEYGDIDTLITASTFLTPLFLYVLYMYLFVLKSCGAKIASKICRT